MYSLRRRLAFLFVFTASVLAVAGVAHAHGNDDHRQGNAGTVKVDDDVVDDAPAPANDPHVICGLRIVVEHGVGSPFDIDFLAQAPTTVAGIVPHPQQGCHIFITVHLPGGDKHKVIWVELCPAASPTTTTPGATTTTVKSGTTTTVKGTTTT